MPILIDDDFAAGITGWSAGAHNTSIEGPDWATGVLAIAAGVSPERSFTAPTTGQTRVSFWWRIDDTTTGGNLNFNQNFYLCVSFFRN
jgi:hypothetical protein